MDDMHVLNINVIEFTRCNLLAQIVDLSLGYQIFENGLKIYDIKSYNDKDVVAVYRP